MTILHFAANQNLVFVPALLALLAATVLICLPIIFVQGLRRSRRIMPVTAVCLVLAAGALAVTGWQGAIGFRTLGDERARVATELQQRYGLGLTTAEVGELVDGGKPLRALPTQAAAAGLSKPEKQKSLRLVPTSTGADTYVLTIGGKAWPS